MTTTGDSDQSRRHGLQADMFEARPTRDGSTRRRDQPADPARHRSDRRARAQAREPLHALERVRRHAPDGRGLGLYDSDTRVLSTYDLLLNGVHPVVLRAGPAASFQSTIQLTNPDLFARSGATRSTSEIVLRRQSLGDRARARHRRRLPREHHDHELHDQPRARSRRRSRSTPTSPTSSSCAAPSARSAANGCPTDH